MLMTFIDDIFSVDKYDAAGQTPVSHVASYRSLTMDLSPSHVRLSCDARTLMLWDVQRALLTLSTGHTTDEEHLMWPTEMSRSMLCVVMSRVLMHVNEILPAMYLAFASVADEFCFLIHARGDGTGVARVRTAYEHSCLQIPGITSMIMSNPAADTWQRDHILPDPLPVPTPVTRPTAPATPSFKEMFPCA